MTGKSGNMQAFYHGWLMNPRKIGAIAPTSAVMAREMAGVARADSDLPVLELGPGTGVITKAILDQGVAPENLVSVEYSEGFLPTLRQRYSGVNFIFGDAFDISRIARELGIRRFDTVISALPLLNFPVEQRVKLVDAVLDLLEPGRPMVQFSYGLSPPVPARPGRFSVSHLTTVFWNLPPARLWLYRHHEAAV
ncbi:MAG: methyltransferase domain-containing protein [Rhodobacteraceae bacterium]|nr:methyltransferase domain-containing protein [Paracoccaceae bacterium]